MENAKNTLMVNLNLILKLKEIIGKIKYFHKIKNIYELFIFLFFKISNSFCALIY